MKEIHRYSPITTEMATEARKAFEAYKAFLQLQPPLNQRIRRTMGSTTYEGFIKIFEGRSIYSRWQEIKEKDLKTKQVVRLLARDAGNGDLAPKTPSAQRYLIHSITNDCMVNIQELDNSNIPGAKKTVNPHEILPTDEIINVAEVKKQIASSLQKPKERKFAERLAAGRERIRRQDEERQLKALSEPHSFLSGGQPDTALPTRLADQTLGSPFEPSLQTSGANEVSTTEVKPSQIHLPQVRPFEG